MQEPKRSSLVIENKQKHVKKILYYTRKIMNQDMHNKKTCY